MSDERFKLSGGIFKKLLTEMDGLSRTELIELQREEDTPKPGECSPAFYHILMALKDLARVELVNRDLMGEDRGYFPRRT